MFIFVSPRVLRAPSTDRPETLPHGRNLAVFYNPTPKIRRALPPKNWGSKTCKISANFGLGLGLGLHPNGMFSGNYISALRGCCAMKFLYALVIEQGNLAHTPTGTGVPPKKFLAWKLKIWPKIQRVRLNNFRVSGTILIGLFFIRHPAGQGW